MVRYLRCGRRYRDRSTQVTAASTAREFSAFQQRFGRGPTPSEEELGEEQWDGIAEKAAQASQKGLSLPTFTLWGHGEAGKSE